MAVTTVVAKLSAVTSYEVDESSEVDPYCSRHSKLGVLGVSVGTGGVETTLDRRSTNKLSDSVVVAKSSR